MFENEYITIANVSVRFNLPEKYIKEQVEAGNIPHLIIKGRPRFKEQDVKDALRRLEQSNPDPPCTKPAMLSDLFAQGFAWGSLRRKKGVQVG